MRAETAPPPHLHGCSQGDLAVCDERGYFRIVDRLKELIKYKGHQVRASE